MSSIVQLRKDTLTNWIKYDPVLADGEEVLVATDSTKPTEYNSRKVGDGIRKFSLLPMLGFDCLQTTGSSTLFPMSQDATTKAIAAGAQAIITQEVTEAEDTVPSNSAVAQHVTKRISGSIVQELTDDEDKVPSAAAIKGTITSVITDDPSTVPSNKAVKEFVEESTESIIEEIECLQELGTSVSNPMSQKAVSDLLSAKSFHFERDFSNSTSSSIYWNIFLPFTLEDGDMLLVSSDKTTEHYIMLVDDTFVKLSANAWIRVNTSGKNVSNLRTLIYSNSGNITVHFEVKVIKNILSDYINIENDKISAKIEESKNFIELSKSISTTNRTWNISLNLKTGDLLKVDVGLSENKPELYIMYKDGTNKFIPLGIFNTIGIPTGKEYSNIRLYYLTQNNPSQKDCSITVIPKETLDNIDHIIDRRNLTEIPPVRLLVLGDSYSDNGGNWIRPLMAYLPAGSSWISLAVNSATIKDRYSDRETYPYTSRPVSSNNSGNSNTLACQIAKLKRLMQGNDLDSDETAIYQTSDSYPNVIIIEGGMNDNPDSNTDNYYLQLEKVVSDVYAKQNSSSQITQMDITIKTPLSEVDRTCFAGAYRYIIEELLNLFPDAQVFLTTRSSLSYKRTTSGVAARIKIASQQRLCADIFNVNIIDWHLNGQINNTVNYVRGSGTQQDPYIWAQQSGNHIDANDFLHPNNRGGKKYAKCAALAIKRHFLDIGNL